MKNLEMQIGQLAIAISSHQKGKFSSDTEVNPMEHCNVIKFKSSKEVEEKPKEAVVSTSSSRHLEEKLVTEQEFEVEKVKKASKL